MDIHVSIYAAHLYDSVVLYAKALDQIIKEEEKKLEEGIKAEEEKLETMLAKIMGDDAGAIAAKERARKETSLKVDLMIRSGVNIAELARNGTRITNEIINMRGFQSISGSYIRIDANGDSEGNFTAFALKSHDYTLQSLFTGQKFHCDNYLMPVGEFHIGHDHFNMSVAQTPSGESTKPLPEYAILKKIDWPKGFKPLDMPVCGYEEEKCQGGEGGDQDGCHRPQHPPRLRHHRHPWGLQEVEDRARDRGTTLEDKRRVFARSWIAKQSHKQTFIGQLNLR